MKQFATITGHVTYTPGDGAPITIPKGRTVEVDLVPDSATLSWEAAEDVAGLAAIPRMQYDRYVQDGKITPNNAAPDTQADAQTTEKDT